MDSQLAKDLTSSYLLVDTCTTLTHRKFAKDLDQVVARFQDSGVRKAVLRTTGVVSSKDALRLCRLYPDTLFCCAGVSPHESKLWSDESSAELASLVCNAECVAVGETGLDFERLFSPKETQLEVFECLLKMSAQNSKPVVAVVRSAHSEAAALIARYASQVPYVVLHSFCGSADDCLKYLSLAPNVFIGLSGLLCKDKCDVSALLANRNLPLSRIVLESDSPWNVVNARSSHLSEEAKHALTDRSQGFLNRYCTFQRNEPCSLPAVTELVAALSGVSAHEVALQTTFNALKVFGL